MNKTEKITFALIALLAIGFVVSITQINNLRWQLELTRHEVLSANNNINFQIGWVYSQVEEMINRQMGLIELASTEIGNIDVDRLTADVTFTLTPRQVSPNTAVSLDFGGELFSMQREGQVFSLTVPLDIFGNVRPMILIDEDDVIHTTQDRDIGIWGIMFEIFPTMTPAFNGTSSHGNGRFRMSGYITVRYNRTETAPIFFENVRVVSTIDGVVTSETEIPLNESLEWPFEKSVALADNQEIVITVIATDSIGLEHHATVWTSDRRIPRSVMLLGQDLRIFRSDGTLLWQREFYGGNFGNFAWN